MDDIEELFQDITHLQEKNIIKNRLTKLNLRGLRKFSDDMELKFSFPLTIIVGKNGSGKTTIMKAIKLLPSNSAPMDEFFETAIDDGGFQNAEISYLVDDEFLQYKRLGPNKWGVEGTLPSNLYVSDVQTKTMVGAIDKSLLYDNIGKKTKRSQQIEYIIKQSKKLKQNIMDNSQRKQRYNLGSEAIATINFILQEDLHSVEVIKHKYYSGTWGTSYIFNDGNQYCEYNAGSGEFVVASIIDRIQHIPDHALLLLDEPEISLHPGAQRRLLHYILGVIKRKKIQVIITTHSPSIVEDCPKESIKCLRKVSDSTVVVEENVFYKNAFLELEATIAKKHIIVEDDLAQKIVQKILQAEGLENLVKVEYYPGGATNIKKYTILTYAKTMVENRYILFDGDQKYKDFPDLIQIPEVRKTDEYLAGIFKDVVGINSNKVDWCVDGNRVEGRYNSEQERKILIQYLNFYRDCVFFLPQVIPEDIIYDEDYLKSLWGDDKFPDTGGEKNAKRRLKIIADLMHIDIQTLEIMLVYRFVQRKNEDYRYILGILNHVLES